MPYRSELFAQGQYYHIFNRGAGKADIFYSQQNYQYLLALIGKYKTKYGVGILAYCLMPNHYHFLLRQETDKPLSTFMRVVFNAYVQALNQQCGRSGTLFEGRFRHKCVGGSNYLMYLCRYIHRNPVAAGLVRNPEEWPFSNYREWIGACNRGMDIEEFIRDHFSSAKEYELFVCEVENEKKDLEKIRKYMLD